MGHSTTLPHRICLPGSFATRILPALALYVLLQAPLAMADEWVRYQRPDGSIGYAQDQSAVPKGAKVLPPSNKPKGSFNKTDAPAPNTVRSPESIPSAPKIVSGPAQRTRRERTPEERYAEQRKQLREEAERGESAAAHVPCTKRYLPNGREKTDCSGRARAKREAKERTKDIERQREELIDKCMDDDNCAPGQVMDDDEEDEDKRKD